MLLEVKAIRVQYAEVVALHQISLEVNAGELVCVVGSNGAGKSTLLKAISGLVKCVAGEIRYEGRRISGLDGYKIVESGIVLVPEGRRLFPRMTVSENLMLGAWTKRKDFRFVHNQLDLVYSIFPILKERGDQKAETLSGGQAQQLAIGRALMSAPRLIMFDEPSLGVQPNIVKRIFENIVQVNKQGITVLLVEQNVRKALELGQRAYVIQTGQVVLSGTGSDLLNSELVQKAYLGL